MNPVPFLLRFVGGWASIRDQVTARATSEGLWSYTANPELYRFEGWGTAGFPPRLACNVKYFADSGEILDLGRIVG